MIWYGAQIRQMAYPLFRWAYPNQNALMLTTNHKWRMYCDILGKYMRWTQ